MTNPVDGKAYVYVRLNFQTEEMYVGETEHWDQRSTSSKLQAALHGMCATQRHVLSTVPRVQGTFQV